MARALIRPHPLSSSNQIELPFPEGATLAQMADAFWPDRAVQRYVVAFVGDARVPCERWAHVRPKAGAMVRLGLTCYEGGGKGKQIFALVATIVLSVYAGPMAGAAVEAFGGSQLAWQAGIMIVGSLAIGALFKPPALDVGAAAQDPAASSTYSITGQQNQATPYGAMLRVYGRHRIFPRLAAVPFTTNEGPNQYLYMLLDCGYGPLAI